MKDILKEEKSYLHSFRSIFTAILIMNLILLVERSVFDFLGFMFGMMIADVLHLMFLIVGLFGSFQYRVNYVVTCVTWCLLWLGWNIFVVCNYLSIGSLDKYNPMVLNLNTDKMSWWLVNNVGCTTEPMSSLNETKWAMGPTSHSLVTSFKINESKATIDEFINRNCLLPFYWIEIIHSSILIFFSTLAIIFGLILGNAFNDEDDTFDYIGGFDSSNVVSAFSNDHPMSANGHIRLEPLYVTN